MKKILSVAILLFAVNGACAQEIAANRLIKLKNASTSLNKALKRYAHCLTKTKQCSEQDKKTLKRAAQTMGALLITYGLVGTGLGIGAMVKRQKRQMSDESGFARLTEEETFPVESEKKPDEFFVEKTIIEEEPSSPTVPSFYKGYLK